MTPSQTVDAITQLRDLFPGMNDEQATLVELEIAKHPFDLVRMAFRVHYETHPMLTGCNLIAWLKRESKPDGGGAKIRHDAEIKAYAVRQSKREAEAKILASDIDSAKAIVLKLPCDHRERLKGEVLAKTPFLAIKLAGKDVMSSPMLISLIAQELRRTNHA